MKTEGGDAPASTTTGGGFGPPGGFGPGPGWGRGPAGFGFGRGNPWGRGWGWGRRARGRGRGRGRGRPGYYKGVKLDRPGTEKIKESLMHMKAAVKNFPDAHEKHRPVAEHCVSNLTKLAKENCSMGPDDELEDYDGPTDSLSHAKEAKKALQSVPEEELLNEKQLRNYHSTMNTIQAYISRVTDVNYRPAKVKWHKQNVAGYENPDWKDTMHRRRGERSRRDYDRDRSYERERRRRRRRSRSRSRSSRRY